MSVPQKHIMQFQLKNDPTLHIDVCWYKSQQLHPPLSRLCGTTEGTNSARIAECLGLDPSKYAVHEAMEGGGAEKEEDDQMQGERSLLLCLINEEYQIHL